jgi:hypothetical protein
MAADRAQIPDEKPAPSSAKRVAALVLGTLLLVAAANEAARQVLRAATPNIGYALVPQKWRLLQARTHPVDWLLLGDSACNQGLDPAQWSRVLGGEALNLCTVASSLALDAAWMLDWHVQNLGPPGAVAVIHAHHLWHRELEPFAVAHVPLPWGFWSRRGPALHPGLHWQVQAALARYVPLYAEHRSLARIGMRPWLARRHYRVDERGFMRVERARGDGVARDAARRLAWLEAQDGVHISPENRAALAHLGMLADRHGFDVYLARPPVHRSLASSPAYRRFAAELDRALRELASPYARLHVLGGEHVFDTADMQNADHLLADAAARYTRALAAEVGRRHTPVLAGRREP